MDSVPIQMPFDGAKVCRTCGDLKPIDCFHRHNASKDGHEIYCKSCSNEKRRTHKIRAKQADFKRVCNTRRDRIAEDGTVRCSRCRLYKEPSAFARSNGSEHGYCKPCRAEWAQQDRKKLGNAERIALRRKAKQFGLSLIELDALISAHGGKCGICGEPGGVHGLCIDHDHDTGTVRGMLCSSCNAGIAMLKHDAERMRLAIAYVKKWDKIIALPTSPSGRARARTKPSKT